ncbi:MAG: 16S rRNA (uracil(1498)-N(3))-methyltransferase [Muribaculaceae bacterium]|nr:16S rRNA (uracil(1498)-N(3))-methyltransferase [Muribaculaceae bacterium]
MIQFYAPDIATTAVLPETDSQHCVRVLRMREGDEVQVVDGAGRRYHCTIALAHSKHTALRVESVEEQPRVWPCDISVAVAPTKHLDRMEWLVEKLVEIGVDRITPLRCARSERKDINCERLRKIAVAAMKQSLKAVLPRIDDIMPLASYLAEEAVEGEQRFVGYCDEDVVTRRLLARSYSPGCPVRLLIGPEGDFTPAEIAATLEAGYTAVTMGDNRLRTETAALVACDTVHIINQINQQ